MPRKRKLNLSGMRMLRVQWRENWQSIHPAKPTIERSEGEAMSTEQKRAYGGHILLDGQRTCGFQNAHSVPARRSV